MGEETFARRAQSLHTAVRWRVHTVLFQHNAHVSLWGYPYEGRIIVPGRPRWRPMRVTAETRKISSEVTLHIHSLTQPRDSAINSSFYFHSVWVLRGCESCPDTVSKMAFASLCDLEEMYNVRYMDRCNGWR